MGQETQGEVLGGTRESACGLQPGPLLHLVGARPLSSSQPCSVDRGLRNRFEKPVLREVWDQGEL